MAGIITGGSAIVGGGTGTGGGGGGGMTIGGAVGGGIAGSVLFVTSGGVLSQDNTGFYYDDVDHQLLINAGAVGKPSLILGDDTTGLYRPAVDQIGFALGGIAAVRFGGVGPDSDQIFAVGRCLIDSRTTDRMVISHRDQTGTAAFAIQQTATGGTTMNSASGTLCGIATGGSTRWYVDGTTLNWVPAIDNGAGADLGNAALRIRNIFLGSYQEMTEMTAPAAPATNKVRFFAQDNGAGKTQLMALFPTGAAVQIAIEP